MVVVIGCKKTMVVVVLFYETTCCASSELLLLSFSEMLLLETIKKLVNLGYVVQRLLEGKSFLIFQLAVSLVCMLMLY